MTDAAALPRLPHSLGRKPKRGDLYSPDQGEHAGHVIEFQGVSEGHINCGCGAPSYRAWLVRCLDCLQSWTFGDPYAD